MADECNFPDSEQTIPLDGISKSVAGLNLKALAEASEKAMAPYQGLKDLTQKLNLQNEDLRRMFEPMIGPSFLSAKSMQKLGEQLFPKQSIANLEGLRNAMDLAAMPPVSSARQLTSVLEASDASMRAIQRAKAEDKAVAKKAMESQVQAVELLSEIQESQKSLAEAMTALLQHSLKTTQEQASATRVRDAIEDARSRSNLKLTRIAAWSGVIAAFVAIASLAWQVAH